MTEQLTVVAHLRALNGQIEETKKFLMALIGPTRAEPGCVEYWLHQDNDDPAEFTFYENWTNRPEWDKHMEMPHLQKFAEAKDKVFELQKLRLMTMIKHGRAERQPRGALGSQRSIRVSKQEWASGVGYRRPFPALTVRPGLYTSTMPPSDMMTCPVM
jgi:quinol monooxygenase YgiN